MGDVTPILQQQIEPRHSQPQQDLLAQILTALDGIVGRLEIIEDHVSPRRSSARAHSSGRDVATRYP